MREPDKNEVALLEKLGFSSSETEDYYLWEAASIQSSFYGDEAAFNKGMGTWRYVSGETARSAPSIAEAIDIATLYEANRLEEEALRIEEAREALRCAIE